MTKLTASQDVSQFLASANKTEAVNVLGGIKTENLLGSTLIIQADDTVKAYLGNIGSNAFNGQSTLKGLSLGSSVTSIGIDAFASCSNFAGSLTIPNSVTTIGDGAFSFCYGFNKSLTIGNSVNSIGSYAFYNCYNFTGSLNIPNSVTSIGTGAFAGGQRFAGLLTIGNSVTTIGNLAFQSCSEITQININRATAPTFDANVFQYMTGVSPAVIHVPSGASGYAASYNGLTVVYDL